MSRVLALLVVGGLSAASALGASPDPKDLAIPPQDISKARELIRKLGSEAYREREDAHAELAKMGRLARPALLEAATSDVVEAEIRLPGNVGRRRLDVRPSRPDVRILGPSELTIDGETYPLRAGDAFCFRSNMPHFYRNVGKERASILWVCTPPTF